MTEQPTPPFGDLDDDLDGNLEKDLDRDWAHEPATDDEPRPNGYDDGLQEVLDSAEEFKPTRLFVPFDPRQLQGLEIPQRRWLVKDWIPMRTATTLYGKGGEGKTLLALQLAIAAALGMSGGQEKLWLGLPVKPSRAMLFLCEDEQDEIHRRAADILKYYGADFKDLGNLRWQSRAGLDNLLMTFDHDNGDFTQLFDGLKEEAREFGAQLVVVDTLADTFGGDEIKRVQVRQFVQGCLIGLAHAIDGATLLTAHPSRAGEASGEGDGASTAWNATVRSRLYLSHPKAASTEDDDSQDDNVRVLSRKKANYAPTKESLRLVWKEGLFVPEAKNGLEKIARDNAADAAFLKALDSLTTKGQNVSAAPTANNNVPKLMTGLPETKGFKRDDLVAAMDRLLQTGKIRVENYGKASEPRKRIVRSDDEKD